MNKFEFVLSKDWNFLLLMTFLKVTFLTWETLRIIFEPLERESAVFRDGGDLEVDDGLLHVGDVHRPDCYAIAWNDKFEQKKFKRF